MYVLEFVVSPCSLLCAVENIVALKLDIYMPFKLPLFDWLMFLWFF